MSIGKNFTENFEIYGCYIFKILEYYLINIKLYEE